MPWSRKVRLLTKIARVYHRFSASSHFVRSLTIARTSTSNKTKFPCSSRVVAVQRLLIRRPKISSTIKTSRKGSRISPISYLLSYHAVKIGRAATQLTTARSPRRITEAATKTPQKETRGVIRRAPPRKEVRRRTQWLITASL